MPEMDDDGNYSYKEDEADSNFGSYTEEYRDVKQNNMISLCAEVYQSIYEDSQERTKALKSELFTWHFCEMAKKFSQLHVLKNFSHKLYEFINDDIVVAFLETKTIPSHKKISEKHQTTEGNVSKHWKSIELDIRRILKNRNI